jgi:NAD(P) transhydrogenase subunit alpha
MSVTNAISAIIVVGCLVGLSTMTGIEEAGMKTLVAVLSVIGITLASINAFGGFTVTQRMLAMFKKG